MIDSEARAELGSGLFGIGPIWGGGGLLLGVRTGTPARGDGMLKELRRWPLSLDPGRGPFPICDEEAVP